MASLAARTPARGNAEGGGGERTQNAVDSAAVESETAETGLQIGDVVAAQVGRGEEQQPIAEPPRGLYKCSPSGSIADAIDGYPSCLLKAAHGAFGDSAIHTWPAAGRRGEPGSTEAALKIADGLVVLTRGQRELARNSSSSCMSWPLPLAPTRRLAMTPLVNTSNVGMLITLYFIARSGFSSTLSLAIVILPSNMRLEMSLLMSIR